MVILATVATGISFTSVVAFRLYFSLRFPKCKNCGWITKHDGRCKGCGSRRYYKWQ